MVTALHFHCRRQGFNPQAGNEGPTSCMMWPEKMLDSCEVHRHSGIQVSGLCSQPSPSSVCADRPRPGGVAALQPQVPSSPPPTWTVPDETDKAATCPSNTRSPQPLPAPTPRRRWLVSAASSKWPEARGEGWGGPPPSKVKQPRARRQGRELHHGSVRGGPRWGLLPRSWGRGDLAGSEVKRRRLEPGS